MILLIQFRTDQSGWHELKCVFESCNLKYDSYHIFNASSEINTTDDLRIMINKADKVLLGGLGESGYEEEDPEKRKHFDAMVEKIREPLKELVLADNKPVLGFCFGHQLIADVLGVEVRANKDQAETGVCDISLSEEGKIDPVFKGISSSFKAIEGHKSSVMELPKEATLLASSDKCPIQAYRVGKNVYGTQFHSELNIESLNHRLALYPEYKANASSEIEDMELETEKVLENFLKL